MSRNLTAMHKTTQKYTNVNDDVDDLPTCFPGHHKEIFIASSKCHAGIGDQEWIKFRSPNNKLLNKR